MQRCYAALIPSPAVQQLVMTSAQEMEEHLEATTAVYVPVREGHSRAFVVFLLTRASLIHSLTS